MQRTLYIILIGITSLLLTACGGGTAPQSVTTTSILSDHSLNGEISLTSSNTASVLQGRTQSLFAGVDQNTLTEYRAFLDFPLGGAVGVPYGAVIDSAYLDIYVNSVLPSPGTVPLLIDLISYPLPTLVTSDYDRNVQPPLASTRPQIPITSADVGHNVSIDITSLMIEAQARGLSDLQLRILQDFVPYYGLFEIDDTTGIDRSKFAPVLTVSYH